MSSLTIAALETQLAKAADGDVETLMEQLQQRLSNLEDAMPTRADLTQIIGEVPSTDVNAALLQMYSDEQYEELVRHLHEGIESDVGVVLMVLSALHLTQAGQTLGSGESYLTYVCVQQRDEILKTQIQELANLVDYVGKGLRPDWAA